MATLGCHIAQWWLRYADVTDLPYRPPEHKDVILHQNKFLSRTDKYGRTAWHIAAEKGNSEILPKLWEWTKENLTPEEIKYILLLKTDYEGTTAWHIAALRGNSEILQKLWECAKENLTPEEIKKYIVIRH